MNSLLQKNQHQLEKLCRSYHVKKLEVFGSAALDRMNADSDIDFLVEFEPGVQNRFDLFFNFQQALTSLFGCPIDLIEPNGLRNPYFIKSVNESKRTIYAPGNPPESIELTITCN
ncbi:MAG: nucleotidyltransferase domain-containing protein [Deltaproteobacteria bacterium]|nr:nucleotidyltransferase domain-containing protein [Deltaproteobacteria bacterium]